MSSRAGRSRNPTVASSPVVIDDWASATREAGDGYTELLASRSLSVGRYTAPPAHEDNQTPHADDEVYFVTGGEADLLIDDQRHHVSTGSVAYVPAGTPHRFTNVTRAIEVLVFFAANDRVGTRLLEP